MITVALHSFNLVYVLSGTPSGHLIKSIMHQRNYIYIYLTDTTTRLCSSDEAELHLILLMSREVLSRVELSSPLLFKKMHYVVLGNIF